MTKLYAPVNAAGQFRFAELRQKKRDVAISQTDQKHGDISVRAVSIQALRAEEIPAIASEEEWVSRRLAWIIQNPDESFWWDTLAETEEETRAWWGPAERATKREALGFRVIPVLLETCIQ